MMHCNIDLCIATRWCAAQRA